MKTVIVRLAGAAALLMIAGAAALVDTPKSPHTSQIINVPISGEHYLPLGAEATANPGDEALATETAEKMISEAGGIPVDLREVLRELHATPVRDQLNAVVWNSDVEILDVYVYNADVDALSPLLNELFGSRHRLNIDSFRTSDLIEKMEEIAVHAQRAGIPLSGMSVEPGKNALVVTLLEESASESEKNRPIRRTLQGTRLSVGQAQDFLRERSSVPLIFVREAVA